MAKVQVGHEARRLYASLYEQHREAGGMVVLSVENDHVSMAFGESAEADHVSILPLGTRVIAERFFRHAPPSAFELENSIKFVEDEIASIRRVDGARARLYTRDPMIHEIALHAGVVATPVIALSREAVEGVFGRLASITEGQSASYAGIPTEPEFLATLLVLRELMHHRDFAEIFCV